MPRHLIRHPGGSELPGTTRDILTNFFSKDDIDKLEILGGTVEIAISTVPRGIKKKKDLCIDMTYVQVLRQMADNGRDIKTELMGLTGKQLRKLSTLLELPSSSHLTNRQLIGGIENRLLSPRRWNYIIDHKSNT